MVPSTHASMHQQRFAASSVCSGCLRYQNSSLLRWQACTVRRSHTSVLRRANPRDATGPQGPNAGALQICVDLCTSTTSFIVRQSSDMLQSIAPGASREKVETFVTGTLSLVLLALAKSMLSWVLLIGIVALVYYATTQVFTAETLRRPRQTPWQNGPGSTWQDPGRGPQAGPVYGYNQHHAHASTATRTRQQHQQQARSPQQTWQRFATDQGDVIDVWHAAQGSPGSG
eukprot:jgi/Chrzof1/7283/Cz02g17220.t1